MAYERSGYGPQDVQLIELHDAFTIEELVYYEALGLVPEGEGVKLLVEGSTVLTGRIPVNSSGGLISMGHPLGPTGLGQIAEILWQMRRTADGRFHRTSTSRWPTWLGPAGVCDPYAPPLIFGDSRPSESAAGIQFPAAAR